MALNAREFHSRDRLTKLTKSALQCRETQTLESYLDDDVFLSRCESFLRRHCIGSLIYTLTTTTQLTTIVDQQLMLGLNVGHHMFVFSNG